MPQLHVVIASLSYDLLVGLLYKSFHCKLLFELIFLYIYSFQNTIWITTYKPSIYATKKKGTLIEKLALNCFLTTWKRLEQDGARSESSSNRKKIVCICLQLFWLWELWMRLWDYEKWDIGFCTKGFVHVLWCDLDRSFKARVSHIKLLNSRNLWVFSL